MTITEERLDELENSVPNDIDPFHSLKNEVIRDLIAAARDGLNTANMLSEAREELNCQDTEIKQLEAERDALKAQIEAREFIDGMVTAAQKDIETLTAAARRCAELEADNEQLREALERARPLVQKWCAYQGNTEAIEKEFLDPIDIALANTPEPEG